MEQGYMSQWLASLCLYYFYLLSPNHTNPCHCKCIMHLPHLGHHEYGTLDNEKLPEYAQIWVRFFQPVKVWFPLLVHVSLAELLHKIFAVLLAAPPPTQLTIALFPSIKIVMSAGHNIIISSSISSWKVHIVSVQILCHCRLSCQITCHLLVSSLVCWWPPSAVIANIMVAFIALTFVSPGCLKLISVPIGITLNFAVIPLLRN